MGAAWLVFGGAVAPPRAGGGGDGGGGDGGGGGAAGGGDGGGGGGGAIVCVGLACMDSTVWVAAPPQPDSKCRARRSLSCGGGNAANSAVRARARAGVSFASLRSRKAATAELAYS